MGLRKPNTNVNVITDSNIHIPLDIPTYDGNPNVAHPSVVFIPEGFNGYRYWMAFTPFPNSERENPSVVASNDGVDWIVPQGLSNPIALPSEAVEIGLGYWSDTHIVHHEDELWVYYRGVSSTKETVVRKRSKNGITWSEQEIVLTVSDSADSKLLSPTIIKLPDGSFAMYCADSSYSGKNKITKRTSTDGLVWSSPVLCELPIDAQSPWHLDVAYDGIRYHMLYDNNGSWDLIYLYSYDGINWLGDTLREPIKRSGFTDLDGCGFYRSALIAIPGNPTKFDIWVNTINGVNQGFPTVEKGNDKWRMVLYKNVDLYGGETVKVKDIDAIWIPADEFVNSFGTQPLNVQNQTVPYRTMLKGVTSKFTKTLILPRYYDKLYVEVYWYNLGSSTDGNVYITASMSKKNVGANITVVDGIGFGMASESTAEAQYTLVKSPMMPKERSINLQAGTLLTLTVERSGGNAKDTLLEDIAFIGIKISTRK